MQTTKRGVKPKTGEPVLTRAFRLLAAFDSAHLTLTLSELSTRTGTPLSTTSRLAGQLLALGALERQDGSSFTVGLRLLETATLAPRGHGLRTLAMPYMEDLHHATRNHVLLAVPDGDDAVIIERLSAHAAGRIMYRIGERVPLYSTGVGLVLLAHADHEVREAMLARDLTLQPENKPVQRAELRRRLAMIRREGVAVNERPLPSPMLSVASPIVGPSGRVIAALSTIVPAGSVDPMTIRPAVVAIARAVSREVQRRGTGEVASEGRTSAAR